MPIDIPKVASMLSEAGVESKEDLAQLIASGQWKFEDDETFRSLKPMTQIKLQEQFATVRHAPATFPSDRNRPAALMDATRPLQLPTNITGVVCLT